MVSEYFVQKIKQLVSDLVVYKGPAPKYLSPFINEDDVVYIYKQRELCDSVVSPAMLKVSLNDDTLDLDLTGQPLECPFDPNETFNSTKIVEKREQDNHFPLTSLEARTIITDMNFSKEQIDVPLFILTDGSDREHSILMGAAQKNGWCTRYKLILEDTVKNKNSNTAVKDMVDSHHRLSHINPINTVSNVTAKYVIDSVGDCHTTFLKDSPGRLELTLLWKTPTFTVPINETSVIVNVEGNISSDASEISHLWKQLILLYDYIEINKTWRSGSAQVPYSRNRIDFPNIELLQGCDESVNPIPDVKKLLLEPSQKIGASSTDRKSELERKPLDNIISVVLGENNEEFTDKLCSLLMKCSSYEEVRSCFDLVYKSVRNGTSRPYIKTTNTTRLAHVLRTCKGDFSHSEMLLEPLELLVEIGIEKLKKEYISIYLLSKIATSEQLNIPSLPKFPEVKNDDWIDHCSKWIIWLMRVHVTLQLMLVTDSIIKSRSCILSLTAATLRHYTGLHSPINELINPRLISTQSFNSVVNTKDITDLLNRKSLFNSWTLTLRSVEAKRKVISIFHRSMDQIFPSAVVANECSFENTCTFPYSGYKLHVLSDLLLLSA